MTSQTTPEGWYDDGSGRHRYWDGAAWTERVAQSGTAESATDAAESAADRMPRHNLVGYVGIGVAVLALIGVSSPSIALEFIGGVLLIVAFALSLFAVFRTGPKWPAFIGMGICVVAAVVAAVLFVMGFMNGYSGAVSG